MQLTSETEQVYVVVIIFKKPLWEKEQFLVTWFPELTRL